MPPSFSLPFDLPSRPVESLRALIANATNGRDDWNMYLAYVAAGLYTARQFHSAMGGGGGGGGPKKIRRGGKAVPSAAVIAANAAENSSTAAAAVIANSQQQGPNADASPSDGSVASGGGLHRVDSSPSSGNLNGGKGAHRPLSRQKSFGDRRRSMVGIDGLSSPTRPNSTAGGGSAFPAVLSSHNLANLMGGGTGVSDALNEDENLLIAGSVSNLNSISAAGNGATNNNANALNASCTSVDVSPSCDGGDDDSCEGSPAKKKDGAYPGFWSDVAFLLKIGFKGTLRGKEIFLLLSYVFVLLLRTVISTRIVFIDGELLQAVIAKDKRALVRALTIWLMMGIPTAIINTLMKYLNQSFAMALRTNINDYLMHKYFSSRAYYKIAPVGGRKNCIPNVDQAVTEDVALWSARLSNLMSFLGRPAFDMCFFSSMLFQNFGFWNQFAGMAASYEVGKLLQYVRPNFSEAIQVKGSLEADLKAAHAKIVAGAEEIAFSGGEAREKTVVQKCYDRLKDYSYGMFLQNFKYFCCEEYVTRYLWSTIGLLQVAYIAVSAQLPAAETAKRVVILRRIMAKNGAATEKFMRGVKLIHEFAGLTSGLMAVFNALRTVEAAAAAAAERTELRTVEYCDPTDFAVDDLVVATPSNEILIKSLTFRLKQGDRLLVLGPNGCGKSSLFRVLCGLWPQRGGKIHIPTAQNSNNTTTTTTHHHGARSPASPVFFLPQKPYVMRGTLREQLHYPDAALREGMTDAELMEIVESVKLKYLIDHAGGLDAVEDWGEILSGGERQRIGLARIFYHKPLYAVLDECSSAINTDAEQAIFTRLCACGTTLITISHRQTLQHFHNKLLIFDSEGGYRFEDNGAEKGEELSALKQQREALVKQLDGVLRGLGEDWPQGPNEASPTVDDMDDDDLV